MHIPNPLPFLAWAAFAVMAAVAIAMLVYYFALNMRDVPPRNKTPRRENPPE
jgi:hypothetical protein